MATESVDPELDDDEESNEGLPLVPGDLGIDPLLLALLHAAAFLDLSDDETTDADAAGAALELVGLYVQRLSDAELERVRAQLERLLSWAEEHGWTELQRDFVADFLFACGVEGEDDED